MDNFNLNNIRFNLNNSSSKAGMVQNSQSIGNAEIVNPNEQSSLFSNAKPNMLSIDYSMIMPEIPKMETQTILKYLQNLLSLPNSMDKFVKELKNPNSKLVELLVENLISTKALSQFLNTNSKEAIVKVLESISVSLKSGIKDVSDLKEVLAFLSAVQTVSKEVNSNSLKELLLLYIPLNIPAYDKNVEFNNLSDEEKEAIKDADLTILFETVNFSNMLISLKDCEFGVLINAFSISDFPKEKFETIIKNLSKDASIKTLVEFKEIKKDERKSKAQNFSIISDDYVSASTLLIAHIIIKTVIKIDNDFT